MTDVRARLRRGYSLGSVATGAFGTVPGLLLPYLTDTLGIAAVVAGFIVFGPKAWDVVLNPISGRISDRFATRRLTRRPFLLGGGIAPTFDLAVPGVTSVSVDLHKYGYTPKGAALLLYRDAALRRPQFFASIRWPGYTMLNSTTQSTRSGGPLAAAWAVTRAIGRDGYARLAYAVRSAVLALIDGVAAIPQLQVVAPPDATLLALAADGSCDVFTICDEMAARGWYVQPQLSFGPNPATLHLSLFAATAPAVPDLLAALRESVAAAVAAGPVPVAPE